MSKHIDLSRIQETSDGDMEFETELIEMYLEDAEQHIQTIETHLAEGDFPGLKASAHTLKGSSANIGATGIQTVSAQLEKGAGNGQIDNGAELFKELKTVFDETRNAFNSYVAENQ